MLYKARQVGVGRTKGGRFEGLTHGWAGMACRTNGAKLQRKDSLQGRAGTSLQPEVANGCYETVAKQGK